ncbi:DNA cytosine methyltransferase [Stenotrophomonas sp. SM006]
MNYYNEWDPYAAQWLRNLIAAGHLPAGDVDTRSITDVQPSDLAGYRQCHFFAGIGGWPLAARLAGWPDDRELWTGSTPCQPFSVAGKGKGQDDDRHLWPHFFELIRARRPAVFLGEQVAAAVGKAWLDGVLADMEGIDYAGRAIVVPACAVNAPHRRDRLWVLAHTDNPGPQGQSRNVLCTAEGWCQQAGSSAATGVLDLATDDVVADADSCGRAPRVSASAAARHGSTAEPGGGDDFWRSSIRITGHDTKGRRVEPSIPLLAHGIPGRVGRLRAYGNAIVPQVAAEVIGAYMDCYPDPDEQLRAALATN